VADTLLRELDDARDAFLEVLADVDAALVTVPGVMEDWSVRDLVVHLAAWAEHGAGAIELAVSGRGAAFAYTTAETDSMNERILADGRRTSPSDALAREDAAFAALRRAVEGLDPALLELRLGNGDTVREVIVYDGPEHYAEHTAHLRAWFDGSDDTDSD